METKYYSCSDRSELDKIIKFDGNYYADFNISIDVIGKINLNDPLEPSFDEEGNIIEQEDTREPKWSDFLFNVIFLNDNKKELFKDFKGETPKTPTRKFL